MTVKISYWRQRWGIALAIVPVALATAEDQSARACAMIESAAERLACYDDLYAQPDEPAPTPAGDLPDRNLAPVAGGAAATASAAGQVAETTEAEFGFAKSKQESEGESLTSAISGVSEDAYRRLIFELDNGQVWRQIEYKRFDADADDVAVIRHGSFGSYKLYIEGNKRWTRVRRVR